MSDQFVAEIRIFPFNFAPAGWAMCNGQLLPITQNTALFSLLGTFYGGDGKSTYGLPNIQGNVAMHQGQGPGLSDRAIGEQSGVPNVTLLVSEIPNHTHALRAFGTVAGDQLGPNANGQSALAQSKNGAVYNTGGVALMAPEAVSIQGSSLPHNNMQPYLTLNYCIAMQGIFPPRG